MMSNCDVKERSKILEWLIEGEINQLRYDDFGMGPSYDSDEIWNHVEKYRSEWDK